MAGTSRSRSGSKPDADRVGPEDYGPVRIAVGELKGALGYFDEDDGRRGSAVVYLAEPLGQCVVVPRSHLRRATHADLGRLVPADEAFDEHMRQGAAVVRVPTWVFVAMGATTAGLEPTEEIAQHLRLAKMAKPARSVLGGQAGPGIVLSWKPRPFSFGQKMAASASPTDAEYARFEAARRRWSAKFAHGGPPGIASPLVGPVHFEELVEVKSGIFHRSFLVGIVDPDWFLGVAGPETDTIAVVEYVESSAPPIVLAPRHSRGRIGVGDAHFDSILEHEFVHVAQSLRGLTRPIPSDFVTASAGELVAMHVATVALELVAYAVEEWLAPAPEYPDLSREQFVMLRAQVSALQGVLAVLLRGGGPDPRLRTQGYLNGVQSGLGLALEASGVPGDLIGWVLGRLEDDVVKTLVFYLQANGGPASPAAEGLMRWVAAQPSADSPIRASIRNRLARIDGGKSKPRPN